MNGAQEGWLGDRLRTRRVQVTVQGTPTPLVTPLRGVTPLRQLRPLAASRCRRDGSLTDRLTPGRGAAEERRIAERCDEENKSPSTWFAFVALSCTIAIETARIVGREPNRHSASERLLAVPAVLQGEQSGHP